MVAPDRSSYVQVYVVCTLLLYRDVIHLMAWLKGLGRTVLNFMYIHSSWTDSMLLKRLLSFQECLYINKYSKVPSRALSSDEKG